MMNEQPHSYSIHSLMTGKTLAERLCVTEGTLAKWRLYGTGPRFFRVGRRIAYDPVDVDAWLNERRMGSTSERGA
jgi:hypothetical protein